MKNKTLLVLAAGMGSRYGGLKQMDEFGPHGETIIDYSIYDAINAGFNKVVFIVREYFKDEFMEVFNNKFGDKIALSYVTQEIYNVPEGMTYNPEREKPWGTMHALLMAKDEIHEPFCVINADDYYGKDALIVANEFFENNKENDTYSVISYLLENTLSAHGTVNRGVCNVDDDGNLVDIKECVKIGIQQDGSIAYPENGQLNFLEPNTLVSMNLFAFYPSIFEYGEELFKIFLKEHGHALTSEFYIPTALDALIKNDTIKVKVLQSRSKWFGVTYREDKPIVVEKINELIAEGKYPAKLWS